MKKPIFYAVFCLMFVQKIYAWWDVSHMLIVQIAKDQLEPSVIEQAEDLIGHFRNDFPKSDTLVTAACFPDDITSIGLSGFKVWHGVLTPYNPDGFLNTKEIGCIEALIQDNNLHSAINQSIKTLKNPRATNWEKSFMLRFLLHCVGDIHQPLHCIQLYNEEFPNGDLAGHRFTISGTPYKNLHLLWDAAFGLGAARLERPLSPEDINWIESVSEEITKTYPPESLPEKDNMNVLDWSKESYDLAIRVAYNGIEPNEPPSQEYLIKGEQAALRQIALAGYRLANMLHDLFGEK